MGGRYSKYRPPPAGIWFTVRRWPSPRRRVRCVPCLAGASPARWGTGKSRVVVAIVHVEEEAAGARYAVVPNRVAFIDGGGGKLMGGEDAMVPCRPMAYPYMVHYFHRRCSALSCGEGTHDGERRGLDRDRDAPRQHAQTEL